LDEDIQAEDIGEGSVQTSEIQDETIQAADIDTGSVTTSEILDESVKAQDIDTSAITSSEIADNTIRNNDIADSTINLSTKVKDTLPVENGGTGVDSIGYDDVVVGNGKEPLKSLSVYDSAMVLTNKKGKTELYKLRAGARANLSVDTANNTVTISAVEQGTGQGTGVGTITLNNFADDDYYRRNLSIGGVQLGNFVMASADTDLKGITMTAYVKSAGKVDVVFYNGTGSTVSLGTFNVKILNLGN